jgi:predicted secreted protein
MTTLRRRPKPSSIDACIDAGDVFEKATSGELAILRTAVENAGSARIRLQSSKQGRVRARHNLQRLQRDRRETAESLSGSQRKFWSADFALDVLVGTVMSFSSFVFRLSGS